MATFKYKPLPLNELDEAVYGPADSESYDLTHDYDWTLAPKKGRDLIPSLTLIQYEMDANALLTNLKYWFQAVASTVSGDGRDPYKGMYIAKPTGVEFYLPWLEDYHHNITQNWEDFKGLESTKYGEDIIKGFAAITNSPGVAINTPKIWKGAARATVPYSITLFNATNEPSKSIAKNRRFINRLISSTLHDQKGFVSAGPPALYKMIIPAVRYSPACVISNLEVKNMGTIVVRKKGEVVPEAWKVSFTINELLSESRQLFEGSMKENSRVDVFVDSPPDQATDTPAGP
jgi:hypothetical protein